MQVGIKFEQRNNIIGIIFTANAMPGLPLKETIMNGDSVILHIGSEQVLVQDVQILGGSQIKGRVHGFEPSFALEYQGLKIDDEVEFREANVFSCSSV